MENARHIRMAQARRGARFLQEALARIGAGGETRIDDLERDERIEIDVARLVGHAHRAAPQFPAASRRGRVRIS